MVGPEDIRRIALALPEAHEAPHFDATSFRVKGKIFCTLHPGEGRLVVKLDPEDQRNLIEGHAGLVSAVEGYWGRSGWTRVASEGLDEGLAADVLRMAWAQVAPKRLVAAQIR